MYNIILFNMATFYDWDRGAVNRNYFVLNALAREKQVDKIISVDFLPLTWRQATKHYWRNLLIEPKTAEMIYGDLTSACYARSEKLFVYTTIDSMFSFKKVADELRRIEKILNLKNIVFWSYNPMFVEFIGALNEKLFVFDAVDNWAHHEAYCKIMPKNLIQRNYGIISGRADLIFTVSNALSNYFKKLGRKSDLHWIPNGVDYNHINNKALTSRIVKIGQGDKKIIGYIGTIENRLDFELLDKIADFHDDKEIIMIGPIWKCAKKSVRNLQKRKNITFIGPISYQNIPAYLARVDVAIIPHRSNEFVRSMNPMKLYDYLAAGKPVVSTPHESLSAFKELVYAANSGDEFCALINKALRENSLAMEKARRDAVKPYDWQSRVDEMTRLLRAKL